MTPLRVSIVAAIAAILLLLVIFELIRSRRLRERYALLWLLTGLVLLALSAWRDGLDTIAGWVGVTGYPDRKSTRLNSSHANISYAVFCLKKKKKHTEHICH